jgi:hypothetical protein
LSSVHVRLNGDSFFEVNSILLARRALYDGDGDSGEFHPSTSGAVCVCVCANNGDEPIGEPGQPSNDDDAPSDQQLN